MHSISQEFYFLLGKKITKPNQIRDGTSVGSKRFSPLLLSLFPRPSSLVPPPPSRALSCAFILFYFREKG